MKRILGAEDYTPKTSILINGEMVCFRPLTVSDELALKCFFTEISEREAETLRDDVRDPETIYRWIQTIDYRSTLPLLVWNEPLDRIVGVGSLHYMSGVHRHIADIRIVVGKSHRKLGLGSAMIKELVELGTQQGLHFLSAEILTDNQLAIKAFRQLGFEAKCTLEEFFLTRKGEFRDVVLMLKRLRINMEEDFFYVF